MPVGSYITRMLATAFLSGEWTYECLKERGDLVLNIPKKRRWLGLLIKAVLSRCPTPPNHRRLTSLLEYLWTERDLWQYADEIENPSLLGLPRPTLRPAVGLGDRVAVPDVTTPGELAIWLDLSWGQHLDWYTDWCRPTNRTPPGLLHHYRYRWLPKGSGGWRLLEIPKRRLKQIQRQILHGILDHLPPHSAAHAFRTGYSVASYVAPHAGQQIILHVDLRDFFPSIRASRVHALFCTMGFPDPVARRLTSLCTHSTPDAAFRVDDETRLDLASQRLYRQRHLPQGAPTSPALANLCAWRLDVRLTALAEQFGGTYTRYADDLLFSGGHELAAGMSRFRTLVLTIALEEGFQIRARKTRVLPQSGSQRVAGIVLNEHPNPGREDFDQLKALLFNCVRHGPTSQNRDNRQNFAQHLQGRIAYLTMINPQRGSKLKSLFDQIQWVD